MGNLNQFNVPESLSAILTIPFTYGQYFIVISATPKHHTKYGVSNTPNSPIMLSDEDDSFLRGTLMLQSYNNEIKRVNIEANSQKIKKISPP